MERVASRQYLRIRVPSFDTTPIVVSKWYLHAVDVSTEERSRFLTGSRNWMKIVDSRQWGRLGLSIREPVNQSTDFMNLFAEIFNSCWDLLYLSRAMAMSRFAMEIEGLVSLLYR